MLDMHEYEVPDLMKMARDFQGHVAESGAFKGMPLNFLYRI